MLDEKTLPHNYEELCSLLNNNDDFAISLAKSLSEVAHTIIEGDGTQCISFSPDIAPMIGLFAKQSYLFDKIISCYENQDPEIYYIISRVIYEASIKMRYLIELPERVVDYKASSYLPHTKVLNNFNLNKDISSVFEMKFNAGLSNDGLTKDDVINSKKLPNFHKLLEHFDESQIYDASYSLPSGSIHSDWNEIRQIYLFFDNESGNYIAGLNEKNKLDLRMIIAESLSFCHSLQDFLSWHMPDIEEDSFFARYINKIYVLLKECFKYILSVYENNPTKFM